MLQILKNINWKVRYRIWILLALLISVAWCYVAAINKLPNYAEMEREAAHRYNELYNKSQPNEKVPYIDGNLYGGIKRDGRYFAIPKAYAGYSGFSFLWPSKTPITLQAPLEEKKLMGKYNQHANKVQIEVFLESRYFAQYTAAYRDLSKPESCYEPANNQMRWNKLIVWIRFDNSHRKDWPAICLEVVRILSQSKEVKL